MDKYMAMSMLLGVALVSQGITQAMAVWLLCQFGNLVKDPKPGQSTLLASGSLATGIALAISALLLATKRRRQASAVRRAAEIITISMATIGVATGALAGPALLLKLQLDYSVDKIEHLLVTQNVTKLILAVGEVAKVRKCCQAVPAEVWEPAATFTEASTFIIMQIHLCAFNASLVGLLLLISARQLVASMLLRPARLPPPLIEEEMLQLESAPMQPMQITQGDQRPEGD